MEPQGPLPLFKSARYLSLSWASSIQSRPTHPTSWRTMLILSFHLRLGLPSGLFLFDFPTETLYTPLLSHHTCYMSRPSRSSRFYHPNNIWWGIQIIKLLIMYFSPFHYYSYTITPPQHPILKHPQPTFLPQYDRPNFTPIQNNRQNYNALYINLYIFGQQTERQKILHLMIASIPWSQYALSLFLNKILICYSFSQIFDMLYFSKGLLCTFIFWFCTSFWSGDITMCLDLSALTSSPVSLLETKKLPYFL